MPPKNRDFHEISTFLEIGWEAPMKLPECIDSVLECLRVSRNDSRVSNTPRKNDENFEIFSKFSRCAVFLFRYGREREKQKEKERERER